MTNISDDRAMIHYEVTRLDKEIHALKQRRDDWMNSDPNYAEYRKR